MEPSICRVISEEQRVKVCIAKQYIFKCKHIK